MTTKQVTAKQHTLIKTHALDSRSSNLPAYFDFFQLDRGDSLEYNWIRPATNNHWLFELKVPIKGRFNWCAFMPHLIVENDKTVISTGIPIVRKEQAEAIFGRKISNLQFQKLDYSLKRFQINIIPRVRHFLAQIAHESGGLRWIVELASGSTYEGRRDLGNIFQGDGPRFKG